MNADQAILFVRAKRPNSIQTRGQLLCVREFAQFLVPLRSVFSCAEPKASAVTLSQYLIRQRHLLHGYEARQMKNVPKIVELVCKRLVDIAANKQVAVEKEWLDISVFTAEVEKTVSQQALQQLGREMKGKGISLSPCASTTVNLPALQSRPTCDQPLTSDNELDPLWRQQNFEVSVRSSLCNTRSLSDSALHQWKYQFGNIKTNKPIKFLIKHSLSHNNLATYNTSSSCYLSLQENGSSYKELKTRAVGDSGSIFKKPLHKPPQSSPLDLPKYERKSLCDATLPVMSPKNKPVTNEDKEDTCTNNGDIIEVPFITLQTELSPENRCLLVAKALAMDLTDNELLCKVSTWQVLFHLFLIFASLYHEALYN